MPDTLFSENQTRFGIELDSSTDQYQEFKIAIVVFVAYFFRQSEVYTTFVTIFTSVAWQLRLARDQQSNFIV